MHGQFLEHACIDFGHCSRFEKYSSGLCFSNPCAPEPRGELVETDPDRAGPGGARLGFPSQRLSEADAVGPRSLRWAACRVRHSHRDGADGQDVGRSVFYKKEQAIRPPSRFSSVGRGSACRLKGPGSIPVRVTDLGCRLNP